MSKPISAQLLDAWRASGLTLEQLRTRATLSCDDTSLSRKLNGRQVMTTAEAQAISSALDETIAWVPEQDSDALAGGR